MLENAFETIVDFKILIDTDGHTKPQPQIPGTFMQISSCIILLTRNSIPSKIAFTLVRFTLRIASKFPTIVVVIAHLKKCHWTYSKTLLDV